MRQRTASVVSANEYFDLADDLTCDDGPMVQWKAAMSKPRFPSTQKRGRTSTVDSSDGTDVEDMLLDSDDEFLDRASTGDRRISFDDDVNIVTIPSRASFDADYKRRIWYSHEEFSRMRMEG